jgi:tetratricopeptide (TPR) repeat protein
MKRWMWLALAAVVVIGVGVTLVALPRGQEWTTSSPEAMAEFEAGMDSMMKLYMDDARENLERAVELDPNFAVAKLYLADYVAHDDQERGDALRDEVFATDTSQLTPRERFIIERARAYREERPEDADALLDEYTKKYPNDPYILHQKALVAWSTGDLDEAERLNQRLVEMSPNWVIAYNQLGYIKMGKGQFAEAEEAFKSYRFIAPDQANPYDSLGELFIALGRYDEAEESFNKALEIKPDFWETYRHIVLMKTFDGDLVGAREAVDRAQAAGAPEDLVASIGCLERYMTMRKSGAWREILDQADSECVANPRVDFPKITTHLAACELGEWDTAIAIEDEAAERYARFDTGAENKDLKRLGGLIDHMKGVRLALSGDYGAAEELLRAADASITYAEAGSATFKLYNQMVLTELLLADSQDAEAHTLLSNIRSVNPVWVAQFEDTGLKMIGLHRG